MVRRVLMLMMLSLLAPAGAHAATIRVVGGAVQFTAAPGLTNNITVSQAAGNVTFTREVGADDRDPFTVGAPCTGTTNAVTCPVPARLEIDLRDQSDRVTAVTATADPASPVVTVPMAVTAGDGNDAISTGFGNDTIDGGGGNDDIAASTGNDVLRGGDGNDELSPNTGTDGISGGEGIDTVTYGLRSAPSFTLDGLANDGDAGESDLIGTDVENVEGATETGVTTLVGDGRANHLRAITGRGVVTGGEGADVLEGGPADDTINARDGSPDVVICAGGTDTVQADTLDLISPTAGCENVQVLGSPGGPFDDRAPAIAWTAPGLSASLAANTATALTVDATDDRGLAKVQFLDDDRIVCEDVDAPFECAYQPRGGDVGRNTLLAVAIDTAGQTTTVVRPVTVRRFSAPGLSLSLRPSRDRRAPYSFRTTGTLRRPGTVAPSQGCSGRVVITARRGSSTVASTRTSLTSTCDYAVTLRVRSGRKGSLRLSARFEGNDVIAARSARSRNARLG